MIIGFIKEDREDLKLYSQRNESGINGLEFKIMKFQKSWNLLIFITLKNTKFIGFITYYKIIMKLCLEKH